MQIYGLIGYPLSHSFSASYFAEKFEKEKIPNCAYKNFPLPSIDEFPQLIDRMENLVGLNVTIPWKREVMRFLTSLDPESQTVGAVNTIKIERGEIPCLKGYNTDVYGFEKSLLENLQPPFGKALVLGSGGASLAVRFVLDKLGIGYSLAGREPGENRLAYPQISKKYVSDHRIIVNTTPLGTYPETKSLPPIPYEGVGENHLLYDLVYNPSITAFMKQGMQRKAKVVNGYRMLVLQAEKSWEIWNKVS